VKLLLPFVFLLLVHCTADKKQNEVIADKRIIRYSIRAVVAHDNQAFTEGLIIHNGKIYESTGSENSWIAEVDVGTGTQNKKVELDNAYFGEGITILNNKIYQLTWQNKVGFIYDLSTYKKIREFSYEREGWGITHNNHHLIVSDGSENIYFLDSANLTVVRKIVVKEDGFAAKSLNELEFIEGYIFANQWQTNYILKIDPVTGEIVGKLDLSELAKKAKWMYPQADVLNGIAYNQKTKDILITGKFWPLSFFIRLN
jgi:glutaminyl-peptide cyclotransferase